MAVNAYEMKRDAILLPYEGARYGYKLVEKQWHEVDGSRGAYYWIYQNGNISDGKFVGDRGTDNLSISEAESLRESLKVEWKPEAEFKEGDLLVTADGTVVLAGAMVYGNAVRQFWYIGKDSRGWDKKATIESKHGKLSKAKNSVGQTFTGGKVTG